MFLKPGGLDCFYIDESGYNGLFVATALRVPMLRNTAAGWKFVWPDYLQKAELWRKELTKRHNIFRSTELHAFQILGRKGGYHKSHRNLSVEESYALYKDAVSWLSILPDNSIVTVAAKPGSLFYGAKDLEACFLGLFQRLRTHCASKDERTNGMLFFDEGHEEYNRYYRKACKYLPTGSMFDGATRNLPLSMFVKDGNFKKSHLSLFVQMADLVSYAALQKLRAELGFLDAKRKERKHHELYDLIPRRTINLKATTKREDGLVVL
jgi:hypothetical protein